MGLALAVLLAGVVLVVAVLVVLVAQHRFRASEVSVPLAVFLIAGLVSAGLGIVMLRAVAVGQ